VCEADDNGWVLVPSWLFRKTVFGLLVKCRVQTRQVVYDLSKSSSMSVGESMDIAQSLIHLCNADETSRLENSLAHQGSVLDLVNGAVSREPFPKIAEGCGAVESRESCSLSGRASIKEVTHYNQEKQTLRNRPSRQPKESLQAHEHATLSVHPSRCLQARPEPLA
jgi:hypothetical protein